MYQELASLFNILSLKSIVLSFLEQYGNDLLLKALAGASGG